jgi:hypothetical protein
MFEDEMFLQQSLREVCCGFLKKINPLFEMNISIQKHKGLISSKNHVS